MIKFSSVSSPQEIFAGSIAGFMIDRAEYHDRTNSRADYRAVIQAVSRRDNARVVIDGMTAANDLGLTTAVPARIEVMVDARLKPIQLGNQVVNFKTAAPSRLYWAGRPAMRVVQALYWLQDTMSTQRSERRVSGAFTQDSRGPDARTYRSATTCGPACRPSDLDAGLRPGDDRRSATAATTRAKHERRFQNFITAPERDRLDIFLAARSRLGTALPNIEKDFWVSWTLNVLYHGPPIGKPAPSVQRRHISFEGARSDPSVFPKTST